jgi:hypothetical protein
MTEGSWAVANSDVVNELIDLRESLVSGGLTPEQVVSEFERLTYLLTGLNGGLERRLAAFVNDLELILFSRMPENQVSGMAAVLADAQAGFDALT